MANCQHNGIPTRLLDVTFNPLIALYFACAEQNDGDEISDGVVYAFKYNGMLFADDPMVQIVSDFAVEECSDCVDIESFTQKCKKKYGVRFMELPDPEAKTDVARIMATLTYPHIGVYADKTNSKIKTQSGAFIMFGMHCATKLEDVNSDSFKAKSMRFNEEGMELTKKGIYKFVKIIIPGKYKKKILSELSQKGYDANTVLNMPVGHPINCMAEDTASLVKSGAFKRGKIMPFSSFTIGKDYSISGYTAPPGIDVYELMPGYRGPWRNYFLDSSSTAEGGEEGKESQSE